MALSRYLPIGAVDSRLRWFEQRRGIRIGASDRPTAAVRITQRVGFASDPRASWHESEAGVAEICSPAFGLLAPFGPLPDRLTELVLHAPDGRAVGAFLNVLIQRVAQLHYRAWAQLRPECESGQPENRFCRLLDRLAGGAFVVPHLAWQPPSPDVLPALARQKLDVRVRIERDAIRWHPNSRPAVLGRAHLGRGAVGRRVAVHAGPDAAVRLTLYPHDAPQLAALRDRRSPLATRLMMLARECHGPDAELRWSVVAPADLPAFRLARTPLGLARLGSTTTGNIAI